MEKNRVRFNWEWLGFFACVILMQAVIILIFKIGLNLLYPGQESFPREFGLVIIGASMIGGFVGGPVLYAAFGQFVVWLRNKSKGG